MPYLYNNPELKIQRKSLRVNMPRPEQILWYYLKSKNVRGYKFRRQYGVGIYTLDFYCPKLRLAIEVDGDSHFNPKGAVHDKQREQFLAEQGIRTLRFTNTEVTGNLEGVINKISEYLP